MTTSVSTLSIALPTVAVTTAVVVVVVAAVVVIPTVAGVISACGMTRKRRRGIMTTILTMTQRKMTKMMGF